MIKIAKGTKKTKGLGTATKLLEDLVTVLGDEGFRYVTDGGINYFTFENEEGGLMLLSLKSLTLPKVGTQTEYKIGFYGRPNLVTDGLVAKISWLYRKHNIEVERR